MGAVSLEGFCFLFCLSLNLIPVAGEMTPQSRALTNLVEDLGSHLAAHSSNSSPRGSPVLFRPPWHLRGAHTHN